MTDHVSRLRRVLHGEGPALVVELTGNSMELARAAQEAGADSVIGQLHYEHPVTHTYTGGLELEMNQIREMAAGLAIPVGVHVGNQSRLTRQEWEELLRAGLDYVCANIAAAPPYVLSDGGVPKILYVRVGIPVEQYRGLGTFEGLEAILFEPLSQVQPEPQVRFNALDVVNTESLSKACPLPVLFKASQDLEPEDVGLLMRRGCGGLVLDPGYTGSTAEHFKVTTEIFRKALVGTKRPRFMGYDLWG